MAFATHDLTPTVDPRYVTLPSHLAHSYAFVFSSYRKCFLVTSQKGKWVQLLLTRDATAVEMYCKNRFFISTVIEEKGIRLKLTVTDTPGFGDHINNDNWWVHCCLLTKSMLNWRERYGIVIRTRFAKKYKAMQVVDAFLIVPRKVMLVQNL